MADLRPDDGPTSGDPARPSHARSGGRRASLRTGAIVAMVVLAGAAGALAIALALGATRDGPGASALASSLSPSSSASASSSSAAQGPASGGGQGSPGSAPGSAPPSAAAGASSAGPGAAGRVAISDGQGVLSIVDAAGGSRVTIAAPGIAFGPAAWSPDGTRVAAIGYGQDATAIDVFDVSDAIGGGPVNPTTVYSSAVHAPFYLYWSPDGSRVAFLANEATGISLRIAPADGSPPRDGPAHDGIVRKGEPVYFAWERPDRLLLHVGAGAAAFTGEVGLDGAAVAPAIPGTGDFRTAVVSGDGSYLAYAEGGAGSARIVAVGRDGGSPRHLPVLGPAAFAFDPTGSTLASIAAIDPGAIPVSFPLGPLRLLDPATGAVRTLMDGSVIAFFWSPDGRRIATLELAAPGGPSAGVPSVVEASTAGRQLAAATPAPAVEVHLSFVDVASGQVRGDRAIQLGDEFISTILPYFDQYALSHRLWAPDSTAIVLPLVDARGRARVVVVGAGGTAPRTISEATSGFWSP